MNTQAATVDKATDYTDWFLIAAPIDAVYEALATPAGIRSWWVVDVKGGEGGAGETMRLTWPRGGFTELRIDRLQRPGAVEWTCTACHVEGFEPPDEWVGTRICFALSEIAGGTRLELVHHGLAALDCIELCEAGWSFHLRTSLRGLLERGEGQPKG
ncbi:MAG TPA: SRPBCC domain-containing protein [Solirubrobacterales bacterium]